MKILKWVAGILIVFTGLVAVWGVFIEPYLVDVEYQEALIPDLPPGWEGQQIGVVSDFQIGMWGDNVATVHKAVNKLVELRPSVVLVLGDFVYHASQDGPRDIQKAAQALRPLAEAGIPMYGVLGNHDYQVGTRDDPVNAELARQVRLALEGVGVRVLHNESVALESGKTGDEALFLVGVGPYLPQLDEPVQSFSALAEDAPRFVMMHNPATFEKMPENAAPVAVAGHTHGGQVSIPFTPQWSYLTYVESEPVHTDGWIVNYGKPGNRLYVNRGIGFSIVPIRISSMPEVTIFTLQKP